MPTLIDRLAWVTSQGCIIQLGNAETGLGLENPEDRNCYIYLKLTLTAFRPFLSNLQYRDFSKLVGLNPSGSPYGYSPVPSFRS